MSKWIRTANDFTFKCSECGCIIHVETLRDIPYGCPNCGIEIDEEDEPCITGK